MLFSIYCDFSKLLSPFCKIGLTTVCGDKRYLFGHSFIFRPYQQICIGFTFLLLLSSILTIENIDNVILHIVVQFYKSRRGGLLCGKSDFSDGGRTAAFCSGAVAARCLPWELMPFSRSHDLLSPI